MISCGTFPNGITLDNILNRQSPRNRRIAEILSLCGLVERSGQGMNLIYEISIMEAKELKVLMRELKNKNLIYAKGNTSVARWFVH